MTERDPVQAVAEVLEALNADGWMVVPHPNTGEPVQERLPVSYLAEVAVAVVRPLIESERITRAQRDHDRIYDECQALRRAQVAALTVERDALDRAEMERSRDWWQSTCAEWHRMAEQAWRDRDMSAANASVMEGEVRRLTDERDALAARLAAVEALLDGATDNGYPARMVSVAKVRAVLSPDRPTPDQEDTQP